MNVLPRMYMSAIDREIAEIKENLSFSRRHGGNDVVPLYEAEIMGLEIAKAIIKKTYYAYQEPLHEKARTEAEAGVRGGEILSLDYCGAKRT